MEYAKLYRFINNYLTPFARVRNFSFHILIAVGAGILIGLNSSLACRSCQLRQP